jgi:hypothetical protein
MIALQVVASIVLVLVMDRRDTRDSDVEPLPTLIYVDNGWEIQTYAVGSLTAVAEEILTLTPEATPPLN